MAFYDELNNFNPIRRVKFYLPSGQLYESDFDANMEFSQIKNIIGQITSITKNFSLFHENMELQEKPGTTLNTLFSNIPQNEKIILHIILKNQNNKKTINNIPINKVIIPKIQTTSNVQNTKKETLKQFSEGIKQLSLYKDIVSSNQQNISSNNQNSNNKVNTNNNINNETNKIDQKTNKEIKSFLSLVKSNTNTTKIISFPIPNTNSVFSYNLENNTENKIAIEFPNSKSFTDIYTFYNNSAYCNGENYLYICGGKKNIADFEGLKIFYKINPLDKKVKTLKDTIFCHDNHTMCFEYPYIFCIGGTNSNKGEIYNIDKKEWTLLPNLKKTRQFSILFVYEKKYIYCFFGKKRNNNYEDTIERLDYVNYMNNLNNKKKLKNVQWEIINCHNPDKIKLNYSKCGIIFNSNKNILIFVGGENGNSNEDNQFYLRYEFNNKNIKKQEYDEIIRDSFRENKFYNYPTNKNRYFQISAISNNVVTININSS